MTRAKGIDLTRSYQGLPDWQQVKAAGYSFAFMKASEGGAYREPYQEQWAGAGAAGILRSCYHFLRAEVNPSFQASFFCQWAAQGELPPVVDFEDAEAHRLAGMSGAAIFENLRSCLYWIEKNWNVSPIVYTGWWYMSELIADSPDYDYSWLEGYTLWLADYAHDENGEPDRPAGWGWDFFQYSSSGQVPGIVNRVDLNVFNGTYAELCQRFGVKEVPVTGIYKPGVPIAQRGRFVWLSSEDKNVDIAGVCAGAGAIALNVCSQASGNMTVLKDAAFQTWVDRATVPALGVVQMDQNLFWNKEITLPVFQARTMWTNETLRALIDQWRSAQIPQAEWDAKHLNITAGEGWHKLGGLVLFMSTTTAKGSVINGMWQQAIVDDLLKPLTSLMQGGYIPEIPIYVWASWDWYKFYQGDETWTPASRIANGQLKGLGLTRIWGQAAPGLIADVPMATPYTNLSEVWQNAPDDTYAYPLKLEGIDFQSFVFSFNRLRAESMFYQGAAVTPVTCGIWCDTAAEMAKTLGGTVPVVPPVDPPPVEPPVVPPVVPPTIDNLLTEIEDRVNAIRAILHNDIQWPQK